MKLDFQYWIMVVGILLGSYFFSFIVRKLLERAIQKRSSDLREDPTKFVFLKNSASLLILVLALITIFLFTPGLKDIGKGLFAGAGILAATIGFASQKVFANIFSGVFILAFKPFRVRDTIEIKSDLLKGVVEEITMRHTVIRDYENRRIIIPNSLVSETTLINSSIVDQKIKKQIEFAISYDSDIDLAKKIITEEILKHPKFVDPRTDEEKAEQNAKVLIRLVALSDFSVRLRAYVWTESNDDAFIIQCDVFESVKKRFDKEGIEIPFPYRTIVFKDQKHKEPVKRKIYEA